MTPKTVDRAALLLFADRLESEARALPRWEPNSEERWDDIAERQCEAETALAQKLRELPDCQLSMCPARLEVRLVLLGIRAQTDRGLAHACQLWADKVRARLEPLRVSEEAAV